MKNLMQSHKLGNVPETNSKLSMTESIIKENVLETVQTLKVEDASEKSFTELSQQERLAQLRIGHE